MASIATSLTETETTFLAAEDFQPGYRYWPGTDAWTITSVTVAEDTQDGPDGLPRHFVTHVRRGGSTQTFLKGEQVAIQGPWKAEV